MPQTRLTRESFHRARRSATGRGPCALGATAGSPDYMFGQFAELEECAAGALFVAVPELELDLELDDEELEPPLAALAIALPPPAVAPVTATDRSAF